MSKLELSRKPRKQRQKIPAPFVAVQPEISRSPHLRPTDILVYINIVAHWNPVTEGCWPSISTLAKESHLDQGTVKQARNNLRKWGLISWQRDRKLKNACIYGLPLFSGSEAEQQRILTILASGEKTTLPRRVKKPPVGKVKKPPTNYTKELNKVNNNRAVVVLTPLLSPFSKTIHKQAEDLIIKLQKWGFTSEAIVELWQNSHRDYLAGWVHDIGERVSKDKVHNPGGYLRQVLKEKAEPEVHWESVMAHWKFEKGSVGEAWLYSSKHPNCPANKLEPNEFFDQIELKLEEAEGGKEQ